MSVIDLRRRLERIEAGRHVGNPTAIMADYPIADDEADAALSNWRGLVAAGRASVTGKTLCITSPEMSESDWAARHVTEH